MTILAIDHVQLAMPAGQEELARAFYAGVLGLAEEPKPALLEARGGVWFRQGSVSVHLGIQEDFTPATKAHPAFLVEDLAALVDRCRERGYPCRPDQPLAGYDRVYVSDPFGNQIELMERTPTGRT